MAEISPTNSRTSPPKGADEAEVSTPSLAMEAAKAARASAEHAAQLTDEHWSSSGPMQARSRIHCEHVTEHAACMNDMPVVSIAFGCVMLSRACQTSTAVILGEKPCSERVVLASSSRCEAYENITLPAECLMYACFPVLKLAVLCRKPFRPSC